MKLAVRANRCQVWLPDRLPEEFSELIRISRLQLSEGSGAPMGHRKSSWITAGDCSASACCLPWQAAQSVIRFCSTSPS
jgi:hypothetical protein